MTAFDQAWGVVKMPTVFHGGPKWDGKPRYPLFFTEDREGAEWYALEHGGDTPTLHQASLNIENPASIEDLKNAAKGVVPMEEGRYGPIYDLGEDSPYDGTNPLDLVYLPQIREALKNQGFDGVSVMDVLSNAEIPVHVPFDHSQFEIHESSPVDYEGLDWT